MITQLVLSARIFQSDERKHKVEYPPTIWFDVRAIVNGWFVRHSRATILGLVLVLTISQADLCVAADPDGTHRTAIVSAYEPEWLTLRASLEGREEHGINGTIFVTGTIERKAVVLFLSGISMVNAAMTIQLALDHFTIDRIVFSGIAGGVDPDLRIGDVVVPNAWSEYLEAVFARETNGAYSLPAYAARAVPNFGMIFPQPVQIARGRGEIERRSWFQVDPQLLEVARNASTTMVLARCTASGQCLKHRPKVVVGGNGVSGQAFVDNRAFREYVGKTFKATVLDMESAAVAHVAYANSKPFIAFRSLSDLAGGGDGENEIEIFSQLASDNSAAVVKVFLKALP
jgi:adenosylhomocysteine nucleosidase